MSGMLPPSSAGSDATDGSTRFPWVWAMVATLPLVLGALAAAVLGVVDPGVRYRISAPGTSILLTLGLGGTLGALAAVLGVWWIRARLRVTSARAVAAAELAGRAEHGRFLARLDHELKNPIMAIRAALATARAEVAAGRAGTSAEAMIGGQLDVADGQAGRLATLVGDLRKLAELRDRPLETEPVDLVGVCADAVESVRETLATTAGGDRRWVFSFPQAPWQLTRVDGDPDLLYVAVHNVVTNAVKFTTAGDTIEVRAVEEDGHVWFEVADTGAGIPPDELPEIFDELARASNARGVPGSGLGLSLVRAIIERHGGRCTIRSRVGEGTSVRIVLPTSQTTPSAGPTAAT